MPPVKAQPSVHYCVRCLDPHAHIFEVTCTVSAPNPAGQRLTLPTWTPGSYLVREFARHFVRVTAHSNGRQVPVAKESKDTWRAAPCAGPLTVTAEIYAFDLSVRTAYLDAGRAYFNGASVFLCPEGFADQPSTVEIVTPAHAEAAEWRVATTMSRVDTKNAALIGGFGTFVAANYDELIDHPVELGIFTSAVFDAGGAQHTLAISGQVDINMPRVCEDLLRICQAQCDLFGGNAPFARYLFLTLALEAGHGGLEHRSSTSLICRRDALPRPGDTAPSDAYDGFLGLASHEYFHSWNVKRIKPAAFVPYDLTRENYTRQLWAFEGITSYYDDLMLARSGAVAPGKYLEIIGRTLTSVLRVPGRHLQSVADASFDAWIKYYRQDENTPNAAVSYYHKGALVALALDLTLRRHDTSLDALMQALWTAYGSTGAGVPEDGHATTASALANTDMSDFFRRYVDGVEDPPLAGLLTDVGVTMQLRAADGAGDRGGVPGKGSEARQCTLGASWAATGDIRLTHVLRGGPAARAGLSAHDVLVAIGGMKVSAQRLDSALLRSAPGSTISIDAFRQDELRHFDVTLDPAPLDTAYLALADGASAATKKRRRAWLFG